MTGRKQLVVFAALLALLLCACGSAAKEPSVVGTWEGEMVVSVLGLAAQDSPVSETATTRMTFHEDGTCLWETSLPEPYPSTAQEYNYTAEGDVLTLGMENGREETVPFSLAGDTLRLGGRFNDLLLSRVK